MEGATTEVIASLIGRCIAMGYRHIDTAELYGNEEALGQAIRACSTPREELYIVTKLPTQKCEFEAAVCQSLSRLGLDYVDLYLIHSPYVADTPAELQELWRCMEELKNSGKARSIGVSNFRREHLEAIMKVAEITPAVNSVEFHPYLQREELIDFHRQHNITTSAYAVLSPLTSVFEGPVTTLYNRLADKYNVTTSAVAIRWCLDQGIAVVTSSVNEDRLRGWIEDVPEFELTEEEVAEVSRAGRQTKFRKFLTDRFGPQDWS
ncbi:aldo keto reductase [Seiridium cupressi]